MPAKKEKKSRNRIKGHKMVKKTVKTKKQLKNRKTSIDKSNSGNKRLKMSVKRTKNIKKSLKTSKKAIKAVKSTPQVKRSIKDPIPKEMFDILACPMCKGDLKYNVNKNSLVCRKCKLKYPIKDGIPMLLPPDMR